MRDIRPQTKTPRNGVSSIFWGLVLSEVQAYHFLGVEWLVDVVLGRNRFEGLHDAGCKRAVPRVESASTMENKLRMDGIELRRSLRPRRTPATTPFGAGI